MRMRIPLAASVVVTLAAGSVAHAFCGFFVAGNDAKLTNNASQVVLLRKGNRTVMTMSNHYQGPPENFAMVVPVPVVLHKEDVKTLPHDVFDGLWQWRGDGSAMTVVIVPADFHYTLPNV